MAASKVLVVWFSKDRAFQLHQALRTFDQFASLAPTPAQSSPLATSPPSGSCPATASHVVLYRSSSPLHHRAYAQLALRHPHVAFVDESANSAHITSADLSSASPTFPLHLQEIVAAHEDCGCVLFGVDDLLFFSPFSLSTAVQLLASTPPLLTVQLALHHRLTFHQPSASHVIRPSFTATEPDSAVSDVSLPAPYLLFEHSGTGTHDFRYPFSLSASLYRREDVQLILNALAAGSTPWHHPNLLEAAGNAVITTLAAVPTAVRAYLPTAPGSAAALTLQRPLAACPGKAVCAVVTVNRVQDVFKNPVCEGGQDVEELRRLWEEEKVELDESRYDDWASAGHMESVHIGQWWLRPVKG
jgi:hypothetical protein